MHFTVGQKQEKRFTALPEPGDSFIRHELSRELAGFAHGNVIAEHIIREKPTFTGLRGFFILHPGGETILIVKPEVPWLRCIIKIQPPI